jgi:hypothetical protein
MKCGARASSIGKSDELGAPHREVLVDFASGLRVAIDDGRRQLKREVYEFWPGDFLTLFEQAGIPRRVPPPFPAGHWQRVGESGRTETDNCLSEQQRNFACFEEDNSATRQSRCRRGEVFWFASKQFVGKADRIRSSSGPQPPAITKLPRWTITAGPVRIASLCDE